MSVYFRWLHDKKHGVLMAQRPALYNMFKQILYAENEDDFDDLLDSFQRDDIVQSTQSFLKYVNDMVPDKGSWAMCHRNDLIIRGNQTNNFCEAQFLVIKDDVLGRQKEVNVVGLLDKLTNELDDHYRNKLLQCASGKNDGIYPRRYRGGCTSKGPKIGYQIPSKEQQDYLVNNLEDLGNDTFMVPSLS